MSNGKLSHFNVSLFKEEAVYIHIPTADTNHVLLTYKNIHKL